jgi:hypothetical protein
MDLLNFDVLGHSVFFLNGHCLSYAIAIYSEKIFQCLNLVYRDLQY